MAYQNLAYQNAAHQNVAHQNVSHQNVAHQNVAQGDTVLTSQDGKLYRVVSMSGNTHMTSSVIGQQSPHNYRSHRYPVPRQMLPPGQSTMMSPQRNQGVGNGCYVLPKPKEATQPDRSLGYSRQSDIGQSETLMHLLLYKDSQIEGMNAKLKAMDAVMKGHGAKEKETAQQAKLLQSKLEESERERRKVAADLAAVKTSKRKLAIEKGALKKHLDSNAAEFAEMVQRVKLLEAETVSLKSTNVEIWNERRDLMQKLEEHEATFRSRSETGEKTSENLSRVRNSVQALEQEKKKLESEKRKLEKSKEEAFQTVQVLKTVVQQKESRIDQLQGQMKEMARESRKADIAVCDCPGKQESLATRIRLKEKEDSEARLGDLLAKMKSQISCLKMEKEKARQQMIQTWDSETNLRTELEREKSVRVDLEKQLGKMKKADKVKAKLVEVEAAGNAEKDLRLGVYESDNARLKKEMKELEAKVGSLSHLHGNELSGEEKEERCKILYKDLMVYRVSPTNCKGVAQCVLRNLLKLTMELPGKEFAWSARQKNPPTPHVSDEEDDEEEAGDSDSIDDGDYRDSYGREDDTDDDMADMASTASKDIPNDNKRKAILTKKLEQYGGLWCTPGEMEDQLQALDKKEWEAAVTVQLQYRSAVLELVRESKLLYSSMTGKQKPFDKLKAILLKLIKQTESDSLKETPEMEITVDERKRMYSPGPDHPILRPRKKRSSRMTWRKVSFDCLHGKVIDHFVSDSDGYRDWQRGVVTELARSNITILYEFNQDSPVKLSINAAREDFDKGDLVACEVTLEDFVGKVIENLWLMEEGATEWWKGHVLKMGDSKGEDTEYEVAYSESKDDEFIYFVPLFKDYWCNEVRILSL